MERKVGQDQRKKTRLLVFADFQLKFVFVVLCCSILISGYLGISLIRMEKEKSAIIDIQNQSIASLVQTMDERFLVYIVLIIFLQTIALAFLVLFLTHRIAGPIYRIQKDLEEAIEAGIPVELAPIRKNDEFQYFFKVLKRYVETFSQRGNSS
jgi:hypothetical protein